MPTKPTSVQQYIDQIPEERKSTFLKLRETVLQNLPKGFKEEMNYNMIGYVVPHSIFPDGYHCDPRLPLPFANIANQKNFIALYHMGIYVDKDLLDWFTKKYTEKCKYKLDMGKSCIRFKKMKGIPYDLIAELFQKVSVDSWIKTYTSAIRK